MGLLLNYNEDNKRIYIRDYLTGRCKWINVFEDLNSPSNNQSNKIEVPTSDYNLSIAINTLKGPAYLKSLLAIPKKMPKFYRNILFKLFDDVSLNNEDKRNNIIEIPKYICEFKSIMSEAECNICTYKIGEFDYRVCKFCHKIFHIQCLAVGERDKLNIKGNDIWSCSICKPCKNCWSNLNNSDTNFCVCIECFSPYHLDCIDPSILNFYPQQFSNYDKWKCENCMKCINCASRTRFPLGIIFFVVQNVRKELKKKNSVPFVKNYGTPWRTTI
jgi:heterodisulfide reductase subunit C